MQLPVITNELNKSTLQGLAIEAVERIRDTGDILSAVDLVAKMEYFIKELKSHPGYIDYAREEVAKFGKEVKMPGGTKIELAEVSVRYDYSKCGDPVLTKLTETLEEIETEIKERQAMLRMVSASGMEIVVDDELVRVFPPSKSSTSSIKTTLSK